MLLVCNCDFLEFSAMKPSEIWQYIRTGLIRILNTRTLGVVVGVSLFFFLYFFTGLMDVPEKGVANLENQSDKFYRISRPKTTRRISPRALLLRSGCDLQYRKNLASRFPFSGRRLLPALFARVNFKTLKSHLKYSFYWFQISSALNPPRTTERLVVYCIC